MSVIEAPQQETTTRTFTNCAIYLKNEFMGNIDRYDCREVTITEGVKYAQYERAIRVLFTPKRRRRVCEVYLTYKPFMVLLAAADAIEPDSLLTPAVPSGTGAMISQGRYMSFDSRWESDFLATLDAKGLKPLVKITDDYDTAAR